jgi:uncharacterized membrane protein
LLSSRTFVQPPKPARQINVSWDERRITLAAGSALALIGLLRRSLGGLGLAGLGGAMVYRSVTGHCPMYSALGVSTAEKEPSAEPEEFFRRAIHVETSVTINRSPDELYRFWRDFSNLPRFMQHLKSVEVIDEKRSRWTAKAPAGFSVQWEAEIINEESNALIAWRSVGGSEVDNAGSVRFVPGPDGRGTEVKVVIDYIPPAGQLGRIVARLFGEEPSVQVKDDLRRFKQLMETGEIPTTQGQPRGTCKNSRAEG